SSTFIVVITFVLFTVAVFVKGFTHELLLEVAVFLVSVKLILMGQKSQKLAASVERADVVSGSAGDRPSESAARVRITAPPSHVGGCSRARTRGDWDFSSQSASLPPRLYPPSTRLPGRAESSRMPLPGSPTRIG